MDPFEFFSRFLDMSEMICQHFTGEDLLKISKINSNWYELIDASEKLRSKIRVGSKSNFILEDFRLVFVSSETYYIGLVLCTTRAFER